MSSSSCRSTHGESHAAPFAAIAAVGELHLNLDVKEGGAKYTRAVAMLNGITSVTQGTDMIVSDLASKLDVEDKDLPEMFRLEDPPFPSVQHSNIKCSNHLLHAAALKDSGLDCSH